MALFAQSADEQSLCMEVVLEIRHETPAGHIRVCAFSGNILADAVNDQHVDIVKAKAREALLCDLQEFCIPGNDLIMRIYFQVGDPVIRILHNANRKDDIHLLQEHFRSLGNVLGKRIESAFMQL